MERFVKAFISNKLPYISKQKVVQIGVEYVDTMLQCGMEFYDDRTPLSLICLLMDICDLQDEKRVKFCSLALCHSFSPVASVVCGESSSNAYGKILVVFFFVWCCFTLMCPKQVLYVNSPSSCGRVVKLLACGARGPGFDFPPRHLNFQRLVISCFQVETWLKDR